MIAFFALLGKCKLRKKKNPKKCLLRFAHCACVFCSIRRMFFLFFFFLCVAPCPRPSMENAKTKISRFVYSANANCENRRTWKFFTALHALCLQLLLHPANANRQKKKNPKKICFASRIVLASSAPSGECKQQTREEPKFFFWRSADCACVFCSIRQMQTASFFLRGRSNRKKKKSQKFLLAVRASCVCPLRNASRKSLLLKASSKTKSQVKTFSGHAFCEIRTEKNKSRSKENRSSRRVRALRPNVNWKHKNQGNSFA